MLIMRLYDYVMYLRIQVFHLFPYLIIIVLFNFIAKNKITTYNSNLKLLSEIIYVVYTKIGIRKLIKYYINMLVYNILF